MSETRDGLQQALQAQVDSGWCPGLVAGFRLGGRTEVQALGTYGFEDLTPMAAQTRFRIASLSKLMGGALALCLVADGTLELDDDVARWLPELSGLRVLEAPDAPLSSTVPARGPITLCQLLTLTAGFGLDFGETPYAAATKDFLWGPNPPDMTADEYLARLGGLPLSAQPGSRWMYHAGADVLSVLLARTSGKSVGELLAERITGPLGLSGTGFPTGGEHLPAIYETSQNMLVEAVSYRDAFDAPPQFESLGGGLLSTIPDFLAFLTALADDVLLPAGLREQMTSDQLTRGQRAGAAEITGPDESWGYLTAVQTGPGADWSEPGMWGWAGGSGTSAAVYPNGDAGVLFTQRFLTGPADGFDYFWEPFGTLHAAAHP